MRESAGLWDNQNVAHILIVGSKKPGLQAEALAFFSISLSHHLHIELEWIPRQHNETTDYLSRVLPTTMIGASPMLPLGTWILSGALILLKGLPVTTTPSCHISTPGSGTLAQRV